MTAASARVLGRADLGHLSVGPSATPGFSN